VHLLVEAPTGQALERGIRGLAIRMAKAVNRLLFQTGPFLADRYHSLELKTARAVRNALIYVLGNFRKHGFAKGGELIDVYSSAPYFSSFRELKGRTPCERNPNIIPAALGPPAAVPVELPQTRLMQSAWRQCGEISLVDAPRGAKV
jgi:hypothetical protein